MLLGAFQETKRELSESQRQLHECQKVLDESQRQLSLKLQEMEAMKCPPTTLKTNGDEVTFCMTNFSLYKQTGKVWCSPPFYYGEGYKLCLAVYANGKGAGAGTHVSVELLLMKGEHDHKLKWREEGLYAFHYHTVTSKDISIRMMAQCMNASSQGKEFSLEGYLCPSCFKRLPSHEDFRAFEFFSKKKFIDHQSAEQLMVNDTIVLKISKRN